MNLSSSTELMRETRHANRLSPDQDFAACKTTDEAEIFFSIGGDGVFWVTSETPAGRLGWVELDLSTQLAKEHHGLTVTAKTFSVAQHGASLAIGLIVTVELNDYFYTCELSNKATSFDTPSPVLPWTYVAFDGPGPVARPTIMTRVYIAQVPTSGINFLVDVVRHPQGTFNEVDRYLVTLETGGGAHWAPRPLPLDFSGETVSTLAGKSDDDSYPVGGVFTFGTVGGIPELVYTQLYNQWDSDLSALLIRLNISRTATAVAASPLSSLGVDESSNTRVYVADGAGISVFTPNLIGVSEKPILLLSAVSLQTDLLSDISCLKATTCGNRTHLWGINGAGVMFQASCITQSQDNPTEWTAPVPIWYGAQKIALFLNSESMRSLPRIFATAFNGDLLEFMREPLGYMKWTPRLVSLCPMHAVRTVQLDSFVTTVSIKDDAKMPPKDSLLVTVTTAGSNPVSVFVNDEFRVVRPGSGLVVPTDQFGTVSISQEVRSLGVSCLQATVSYEGTRSTVTLDYFASASKKLANIKCGKDLDRVKVELDGRRQPLVDASVSVDDKDRAAAGIQTLLAIRDQIVKKEKMRKVDSGSGTTGDSTRISFPWVDELKDFFDSLADKITGFFAGTVYNGLKTLYRLSIQFASSAITLIIETAEQVWPAIEAVLAQVKVTWAKVAAWLRFIFDMDDIRRTHSVLRALLRGYANRAADTMGSLQGSVADGAAKLQVMIETLKSTDANKSVADQAKNHPKSQAMWTRMDSPAASMLLSQFRSNIRFARAPSASSDSGPFRALVDQIRPILDRILSDIQNKQLADQIGSLARSLSDLVNSAKRGQINPVQLLSTIGATVAQILIDAGAIVLNSLLSLLKLTVSLVTVLLDTELQVPVLQQFYHLIAGTDSTFTVLDVLCLIAACPITEMYKIVAGRAPFPDDQETSALIAARDYTAFGVLLLPNSDLTARLNIVATMTAGIGTFVAVAVGAARDGLKDISKGQAQWVLGGLALTSTLLVACPSFPPAFCYSAGTLATPWEWWDFMNDYLATVAVGKAVFDNLPFVEDVLIKVKYGDVTGPVLDALINMAWVVPAAACVAVMPVAKRKDSGVVGLVANVLLCLSGILGPGTGLGKAGVVVKAAMYGLLGESGCFYLMTASLLENERQKAQ